MIESAAGGTALRRSVGVFAALALLGGTQAAAQEAEDLTDDPALRELSRLDFEELMEIEVTSVAGVGEQWFRTPAALYVITAEDARRTGSQTLAEALRLVPGMFVGRSGSHIWRVGPRGFTGGAITSTKNLVLIDGRVVYDPLFSGTFWETQDVLLEDLDRIEVIRGPGATLWGSNAVNGVINVTTKSARDTQGLYITGGVGDVMEGLAAARYGGELGDDAWYRVWGKWVDFDAFETTGGDSAHDDWSFGRMGFRIDGEGGDGVEYTLEGDVYSSTTLGETGTYPLAGAHFQFREFVGDAHAAGGHVLGRIVKETGLDSGWSLQAYYDRTEREQEAGLHVDRHTADLDFRHHFDWGGRQNLVWGARYTFTTDDVDSGPTVTFEPESRDLHTLSAFVQNTSEIVDDRLFAMLGSKFEHNSYTGFEVQPSARLWWTPSDRQTFWGAVSRAVRVPSRLEEDALFVLGYVDTGLLGGGPPSGVFQPIGIEGNDDLESEELIAYELGHRIRITDELTLDTAVFYHDYDRLISVPPPVLSVAWNNDAEGESYGVETVMTWQAARNWRLEAAYSAVKTHMSGPVIQFEEGNTPVHQAQLRSYLDVTDDLELNGVMFYVDELESSSAAGSYLRLDLGVTWRPTERLELALWGQNLLDPEHVETSREVPRGFFLQGTLRF